MKYLELPMTLKTIVRKSAIDSDCLLIEQLNDDDDCQDAFVVLHRSQVADVIEALHTFLGDGAEHAAK